MYSPLLLLLLKAAIINFFVVQYRYSGGFNRLQPSTFRRRNIAPMVNFLALEYRDDGEKTGGRGGLEHLERLECSERLECTIRLVRHSAENFCTIRSIRIFQSKRGILDKL